MAGIVVVGLEIGGLGGGGLGGGHSGQFLECYFHLLAVLPGRHVLV